MDTRNKVHEIIGKHFGTAHKTAVVTDETNIHDDLHADSLDTVELVMCFEEEFDIEISDATAEGWKNVGDAVAYIDNAVTQKGK